MKKDQLEMKNSISDIKNTLGRIKSRLDKAAIWKTGRKNTQSKQQKEKKKDFRRIRII